MSKPRILICDDELGILEVMQIILEENGYKVKVSENCQFILSSIKEFNPSLIIMDVWIKNFDGRDVIKLIRSKREFVNIPVMFISALNDLAEISAIANVNGYLKKPFDIDELVKVVGVLIQNKLK